MPFDTPPFTIRWANSTDVPAIFSLIQALAEYEKLSHAVTGNAETLHKHLFGDRPIVEAIVAQSATEIVGFALFFSNYSTFLTQPGIYLEDLFVLPNYRNQGIGKALLSHLAQIALTRDCGRLEWSVLDWNDPAIAFYERMGATVLPDWRTCRVTGSAIVQIAENS
ncbi:MAG: GNAT family N-acetyltransferase [Leptolyngbyaceae cyanobacterium CSU_1_3]|nr:GNAT family N-acetyltransferase [Leptolyngbyaceae cyanobacterium CSU_1_3]